MARAKSGLSPSAIAAAAQRPGVDPRVWVSIATVDELGFDKKHGIFADVTTKPDMDRLTCLVGSGFVGTGYGAHSPLKKGDTVVVVIPQGDPNEPCVVVSRLWSSADTPPPELALDDNDDGDEPTPNPTVRLEDGAKLRVVGRSGAEVLVEVSGGSSFVVTATDGSEVTVTSDVKVTVDAPIVAIGENASLGIARLTDKVAPGSGAAAMLAALQASSTANAAAWTAVSALVPAVAPTAASSTALANTISSAVNAWGVISTASSKGLCE